MPHHYFGTSLTSSADTSKPLASKGTAATVISTPDTSRLPETDTSGKRLSDTSGLPVVDTGFIQKTDTFNLKLSKDSLEAPLKYSAEDSVVVMIKSKKIYLYGKTKTEYTDIVLTAPKVEMDQATQVVTAFNRKDSTGKVLETAKFK
ncbi:MAG TPA: hypothetical protein PLL23_13435, partial [Chitinophagaceae bacterium]|nr:hypothetical protein [Chitinophagaceae bacterium]